MEERISQLRTEIVWMVKDASVLQLLVPAIIPQDAGTRLKRLYRVSSERANHQLLDWMLRSQEPGKWTAFIQALKQSHYTYLADLLSSETGISFNNQSKVLAIFSPYLEQALNPEELLAQFISKDLINDRDREEISARQRNEGRIMATMLLLERIQVHLSPDIWYPRFVQVLKDNKHDELVDLLEPDFDPTAGTMKVNTDQNIHDALDEPNRDQTHDVYDEDVDMIVVQAINEFREELVTLINVGDILNRLVPSVVDQAEALSMRELTENEPNKATYQLLDHLLETSASARHGFVKCIRNSDYQYLSKLLTDQLYRNNCKYLRKFISIFEPTIQQLLDPAELVSHLECEGVINMKDKSRILTARAIHGKTASAMMMLDCIQCRLEPHQWYTTFLQVLVKSDNEHVVQILEPDFLNEPDQFTRKMYQIASGDDNRDQATFDTCSPSQPNPLFKSLKNAQEHLQIFEKSVYKARVLVMAEKRKKEESIVRLCRMFEETVQTERHKILEHITRINEDVNRNRYQTSENARTVVENISIPNGLTGKIIFKANNQAFQLGQIEILAPEPHTFSDVAYVKPSFRKISKHLIDTESDSSSFLEITGRHDSVSGTSDRDLDKDIDEDYDLCRLKEFLEKDDYVVKSSYQSINVEIQHYNAFRYLQTVSCVDIVEVNSQNQIAGICSKERCVCLFDSGGILVKKINSEIEFDRLAQCSQNAIALMSFTDSSVYMMYLLTERIQNLDCPCDHSKCAISSQSGDIYLLCTGRHLHVYKDTKWSEVRFQGIQNIVIWQPTFVTVNEYKTNVFVYSEISRRLFCLDINRGCLKYEESLDWTEETMLINGLICIGDFLFIFDKSNDCIAVYTAEDFLFKDSLVNEAVSSCKLISKGILPYTLVAICENTLKHIPDTKVDTHYHVKDDQTGKLVSRKNTYVTFTGSSVGLTTEHAGVLSALVHNQDEVVKNKENNDKLQCSDKDKDLAMSTELSLAINGETSEPTTDNTYVIYFLKINVK